MVEDETMSETWVEKTMIKDQMKGNVKMFQKTSDSRG